MSRSIEQDQADLGWSRSIASLVVDAMVDGGVCARENVQLAMEIAAEEISVRLAMEDKPGSFSPIFPCLRYADAAAAIDWLWRAFSLAHPLIVQGPNGTIAHAELSAGEGMIMIGSASADNLGGHLVLPDPEQPVTQSIYVIVRDADAHLAEAEAAGALVVIPIKTEEPGGRSYTCRDPWGHLWTFGTYDPWAKLRTRLAGFSTGPAE